MAKTAYILRTPYPVADPGFDLLLRDQLLKGANDGVRYLYDAELPWCYPAGPQAGRPAPGAPADGAALRDISEHGDGVFRKAAGQTVGFAGPGFELKGVTGRGCYIEIPAAANADLFAAAPAGAAVPGASQQWLESHLMIWPDMSGWTGHSTGVYAPLWCTAGSDANLAAYYATTPERVWMGLKADGSVQPTFQLSLGTTAGTNFVQLNMGSATANVHRGKLTQVAAWRTVGGAIGIRLKSAAGTSILTGTAAANTVDYSASRTKVGVTPNAQWEASGMNLSSAPWRLYRGFIENLARSGRDPIVVLDADWARVQTRIAESAAANGGASQIFL